MTEAKAKAERVDNSIRQEQDEVAEQRRRGNLAWRIAREIDTLSFDKDGIIFITDCKFSDNDIFYIDSNDIAKGLDTAISIQNCVDRYGVPVQFRVDMHFRRHRSRNRKYIVITEADRGYSIKVTRAKRISTQRVSKATEASKSENKLERRHQMK